MKIALSEEIELDPYTAAWLFNVRGQAYITPSDLSRRAVDMGLVAGSFPDYSLSEKGRRIAEALYERSRAAVDKLAAVGIQALPHVSGVVVPFEFLDVFSSDATEARGDKLPAPQNNLKDP